MKYLYFVILVILGNSNKGFAQHKSDESIQDSVIGWWSNNRFDHHKPRTDAEGKKKEIILNDMVKWMKASYTPVGGLGTSSRYIRTKGYGVMFLVWDVSHDKEWTEPNGNFKPIAEQNTRFDIAANQLYGAFPIYFMNTGAEFYFTMQPDGYTEGNQTREDRKGIDPRIHPNAHKYITRMNEWCTVYLAPDNKLPWTPVTKGELLQKAEDGLQKVLADKKKEVAAQWPNSQKTQDEVLEQFTKREIENFRKQINELKKRHGSSLNEKAVIRAMQPTIYSFETDPDLFQIDKDQKDLLHGYQVYKLDSATWAKANDIVPQWVAVSFPFKTKENGNQKYELFTALSQNINYDYIYNYFYNPEKIKGITYTPANASELKARLDGYRKRSVGEQNTIAKKQTAMLANAVLFDDFSQEDLGARPAGWYSNSTGKAHTISKIAGETGNWLKLGYGNQLTSKMLRSLPENFSLEYDIVTSVFDGRWGANVTMEMRGSKKGSDGVQYSSNLSTSITAGNQSALEANHDYRGEVKIDLVNKPSKMDYNHTGGYFTGAQPVFTNAKRKVHIQVLKKDQNLTIFLNGKELTNSSQFKTKYGDPCGDCNIPAGITYDSFVIKNFTQDGDTVDCYIGNIKVTKL